MMSNPASAKSLFQFGRVVSTLGVHNLIVSGELNPSPFLWRHLQGDWGDLSENDLRCNDAAVKTGDRIFSAYQVNNDLKLWIITESDRSVTTLLLPSEY